MGTTLAIALAFVAALTVLENLAVASLLAGLPRLTTDFSPAYLQREMASLAGGPPATLVLGDSVLWGYRIEASQGAVALLRRRGCACVDLAFKGGSPPNDYAMLALALAAGVRPKSLLIEIDDEVFNPEDRAYETLNPSLARAASPYLDAADRSALNVRPRPDGWRAALERALGSVWLVSAMRGDVRETLFGDADAPVPPPSPDLYEGTFDLTPLTADNVGVRYLTRTLDLARARGIPAIAFLTPMNHRLLRRYLENPEYRANLAYLRGLAAGHGATVLDLDRAIAPDEFLDDTHLRPSGQRLLADRLAPALGFRP